MYYYKARYYDPETGRFLTTDPIGYEDQMNLYAYVDNDPVNATDPTGLDTTTCVTIEGQLYCNVRRDDEDNTISFDGGPPIPIGEDTDFTLELWAQIIVYVAEREGVDYSGGKVSEYLLTGNQAQDVIALTAIVSAASGGRGYKGGRRGHCCFVAGTLVQTEHGLIPIQKLDIGDLVLSRNVDTGETELKPIVDLIRRHDRVIWEVEILGDARETETFRTTDDHPWWVIGSGWITTDKLTSGMVISTADDKGVIITRVERTKEIESTFNLEVAGYHTYFVGNAEVLVHNCGSRNRGPIYPTEREARAAAQKHGRTETNMRSHGAKVYRDSRGNQWTRDQDGHNGGAWKKLDRNGSRVGTYNENLERVGD